MSIDDLVGLLSGVHTNRYTNMAAMAIFLYDITLTFGMEVEYVWSRPLFNLQTILYIYNRYIHLLSFLFSIYKLAEFHPDFSDAFCQFQVDFVGHLLANIAWTGILTLRVRALWLRKSVMIWVIYACYVGFMGAFVILASLSNVQLQQTMHYVPIARTCIPLVLPHLMKPVPLAPSIYELFLTVLTVVKAMDFAGGASSPQLYRVLLRDGVAYFLISSTISVVNVIYWFSAPSPQVTLLLNLYSAMMSTLIARLVLHLKVAHQDGVQQNVVNSTHGEVGSGNETTRRRLQSVHDRRSRLVPAVHVETNVVTFQDLKGDEYSNGEIWDHECGGPQIPLKRMSD